MSNDQMIIERLSVKLLNDLIKLNFFCSNNSYNGDNEKFIEFIETYKSSKEKFLKSIVNIKDLKADMSNNTLMICSFLYSLGCFVNESNFFTQLNKLSEQEINHKTVYGFLDEAIQDRMDSNISINSKPVFAEYNKDFIFQVNVEKLLSTNINIKSVYTSNCFDIIKKYEVLLSDHPSHFVIVSRKPQISLPSSSQIISKLIDFSLGLDSEEAFFSELHNQYLAALKGDFLSEQIERVKNLYTNTKDVSLSNNSIA